MNYPALRSPQMGREMISVFRGYNANPRIGEGELADMQNLTSDDFPVLASRKGRGLFLNLGGIQGMVTRDVLCFVRGTAMVMNDLVVEMGLSTLPSDCPKKLVVMGACILVFPDKKYLNTATLEVGSMEASFTSRGQVTYTPAAADGTPRIPGYVQDMEPEHPENMALWLDTGTAPPALMQWSAAQGMWVNADAVYVRIGSPGIGADFREGDGVHLYGVHPLLGDLEGSYAVVSARGEDYLVVSGLAREELSWAGALTVSRKLPRMDYVVACGNRLWGCRYGSSDNGQVVNEIYASKLGDFRNWHCFQGVSTDSYVLSLGAEGPFTGAAEYMDSPIFFREGCIHRIYGSYPAAFRLQTVLCPGVQSGSSGSPAVVDQLLYYKSCHGIRAFDGTVSVDVSEALGADRWRNAVGGGYGSKYYVSMVSDEGSSLFVYDTVRRLWHREDDLRVQSFAVWRGELYLLDDAGVIRSAHGGTESVRWMAETGDMQLDSPDNKYLIRLTLRFRLEPGAAMTVRLCYDGGDWETAANLQAGSLRSVTLPVRVHRCDHLRLRLEGVGGVQVYSITKTLEEGSDVF